MTMDICMAMIITNHAKKAEANSSSLTVQELTQEVMTYGDILKHEFVNVNDKDQRYFEQLIT